MKIALIDTDTSIHSDLLIDTDNDTCIADTLIDTLFSIHLKYVMQFLYRSYYYLYIGLM
jgi:hypothetical protein